MDVFQFICLCSVYFQFQYLVSSTASSTPEQAEDFQRRFPDLPTDLIDSLLLNDDNEVVAFLLDQLRQRYPDNWTQCEQQTVGDFQKFCPNEDAPKTFHSCDPGSFLNWTCGSEIPKSPAHCSQCPQNFYQEKPNNCTACRPCSVCSSDSQEQSPCRADKDTSCDKSPTAPPVSSTTPPEAICTCTSTMDPATTPVIVTGAESGSDSSNPNWDFRNAVIAVLSLLLLIAVVRIIFLSKKVSDLKRKLQTPNAAAAPSSGHDSLTQILSNRTQETSFVEQNDLQSVSMQNHVPHPRSASMSDPQPASMPDPRSASVPDPQPASMPDPRSASVPDPQPASMPDPRSASMPDPQPPSRSHPRSASVPDSVVLHMTHEGLPPPQQDGHHHADRPTTSTQPTDCQGPRKSEQVPLVSGEELEDENEHLLDEPSREGATSTDGAQTAVARGAGAKQKGLAPGKRNMQGSEGEMEPLCEINPNHTVTEEFLDEVANEVTDATLNRMCRNLKMSQKQIDQIRRYLGDSRKDKFRVLYEVRKRLGTELTYCRMLKALEDNGDKFTADCLRTKFKIPEVTRL